MLDKQRRLTIGTDLLLRVNIKPGQRVQIFYNCTHKLLVLIPEVESVEQDNLYFVQSVTLDEKGRFVMPSRINKAFSNVSYLPSEKNDRICIHII